MLQARMLEGIALLFSRGLPDPGTDPGFPALQQILYYLKGMALELVLS